MTINMPVEVVNERCANCPELDVNTVTEANHVINGINDDGTILQKDIYENRLRCANVERCRILCKTVFEKPEEKKTATAKRTKTPTATRKKQGSK